MAINTTSIVSFDSSLLLGTFQAKSALLAAQQTSRLASASTTTSSANASKNTDTSVPPPWDAKAKPLGQEEILNKAIGTGEFFNKDLEQFSDSKAPEDQKKLFELYQGLRRMDALAIDAADKDTTDTRRILLQKKLQEGIDQLDTYLSGTKFDEVSFLRGEKRDEADSTLTIQRNRQDYVTPTLYSGNFDDVVPAFQGDVKFTITAHKVTGDVVVPIDLSGMGTTDRTLDNVADYINTQLDAAGLYSTFQRVKIGEPDENGIIEGNNFGFKILGTSTEPLEFTPDSSTPAIYTVGTSGVSSDESNQAGQLAKWDGEDGSAPKLDLVQRLEPAKDSNTQFLLTQTGPDGEVYAIAKSDGAVASLDPKGGEDIYLIRYDSTGHQVYTRALGAVGDVDVRDLAVGADGSVVLTGGITGELGNTTDIGKQDAFVLSIDNTGKEQFLKRYGTSQDDTINAVTVGSDGTVYLAGTTGGQLGDSSGAGDDVFVRAIDSTGTTLYTRQLANSGEEQARALTLDQNGDLLLASDEDGHGVLRKIPSGNATDPVTWEKDLGDLDNGSINSLAVSGGAILVGGSAGNNASLGAPVDAKAGERDGFLTRVDEDTNGDPQTTWTTYLGTAETDRLEDLAISNGKVYAAGLTTGSLPGGGVLDGTSNSFLSRFDLATGALEGSTQLTGRDGESNALSLAIDPQGTSILDAFGLPHGMAITSDSAVISERSTAREGDSFQISVDGGIKHTIRLEDDDTYRTLTFKINAALILDGKADVKRTTNGDTLKITASGDHVIELTAGPDGHDLLSAIGMEEGVVQQNDLLKDNNTSTVTSSSAPPVYGLGIKSSLDLSTEDSATDAQKVLDDALSTVRKAYRELTMDPALKAALAGNTGPGKTGGTVPEYLSAQISNYSAGLARLSAGSSSSVASLYG